MSFVFLLTFILAACSLLYELAIAQTISLFAVNNVVWYSLTIGTFIGAMGLGAFLCPRFFRGGEAWARLLEVELFLSLVGGISVALVHFGQSAACLLFLRGQLTAGNAVFFAVAFLAAFAVGVLSGAELPLLIELAEKEAPGRNHSARVIGMDYLGSLAGALLFPLVFMPHLSMLMLSWAIALANLLAVAVLIIRYRRSGGMNYGFFAAVFVGLFVLLLAFAEPVQQYFLKSYYYFNYPASEPRQEIRHHLTTYQSIDIVELGAERSSFLPELLGAYSRKYQRDPGLPRGFALYLNHDFQFYSDVEEIYHETFAHVPVQAAGQVPRTVLVLGGGDGLLLRELVKYPEITRIVLVEIDPGVVRLFGADPKLKRLNADAFADKRVEVHFDDAYHFVRASGEVFDAVYLDFPAPMDFSLSRLYSREFYSLVKRRLSPAGFVAVNAPGLIEEARSDGKGGAVGTRAGKVLYGTLSAAGFEDVRPYFSRLEDDEPQALQILEKQFDVSDAPPGVDIRGMVQEELRNILDGLSSGFILARPGAAAPLAEYREYGIPLNVVNAKRYYLSVGETINPEKISSLRRVNSIIRPALPDFADGWAVRTPY